LITGEASFIIAHVLKLNRTLRKFKIDGNPIGKDGVGHLLAATQENQLC